MSDCAHGRKWEQVRCTACNHPAVKHGSEIGATGCLALLEINGGESTSVCLCMLSREEVLYAQIERAINEVCLHKAEQRDRRAPLRR